MKKFITVFPSISFLLVSSVCLGSNGNLGAITSSDYISSNVITRQIKDVRSSSGICDLESRDYSAGTETRTFSNSSDGGECYTYDVFNEITKSNFTNTGYFYIGDTFEYSPGVPVIKETMTVGETWSQVSSITKNGVVQETRNDIFHLEAIEEVSVAAGDFTDCLKINWMTDYSQRADTSLDLWLCPQVGLTKYIKAGSDNRWELQNYTLEVYGADYIQAENIATKKLQDVLSTTGECDIDSRDYSTGSEVRIYENSSDADICYTLELLNEISESSFTSAGYIYGNYTYEYSPGVPLIKETMTLGETWNQTSNVTLNGAQHGTRNDTLTLEAIEDVSVAGGSFNGCLKINWVMDYSFRADQEANLWLCPDFGLAKYEYIGSDNSWELQNYTLKNQEPENIAPGIFHSELLGINDGTLTLNISAQDADGAIKSISYKINDGAEKVFVNENNTTVFSILEQRFNGFWDDEYTIEIKAVDDLQAETIEIVTVTPELSSRNSKPMFGGFIAELDESNCIKVTGSVFDYNNDSIDTTLYISNASSPDEYSKSFQVEYSGTTYRRRQTFHDFEVTQCDMPNSANYLIYATADDGVNPFATSMVRTLFKLAPPLPDTVEVTIPENISHGTVTPVGDLIVEPGNQVSFTVMPENGYIPVIDGCGGTLDVDTFTTDIINENCTISISFEPWMINERYQVMGNGNIIRDLVNNLEWIRCAEGMSWDAELQTCAGTAYSYTYVSASDLKGPSGFRLPTIDELQSLVYCSGGMPAYYDIPAETACAEPIASPTIYAEAFNDNLSVSFWSSSPSFVDFSKGAVKSNNEGSTGYVRLVRKVDEIAGNSHGFPVGFPAIIDKGGLGKSTFLTGKGGDWNKTREQHRQIVANSGIRPVIFLHGNYGNAYKGVYGGSAIFDHLKKTGGYQDSHLWSVSYLGMGNRGPQKGCTPFASNVEDVRRVVDSIMEYLDVDKIDIIGYSLGTGMVRSYINGLEFIDSPKNTETTFSPELSRNDNIGTAVLLAGINRGVGTWIDPIIGCTDSHWQNGSKFIIDSEAFEATNGVTYIAAYSSYDREEYLYKDEFWGDWMNVELEVLPEEKFNLYYSYANSGNPVPETKSPNYLSSSTSGFTGDLDAATTSRNFTPEELGLQGLYESGDYYNSQSLPWKIHNSFSGNINVLEWIAPYLNQ